MTSRYESLPGTRTLPAYPVECFAMADNRPGVFASSHWHQYGECLYVRTGAYEALVNGRSYRLLEGELLYILPRRIHTTICPDIPLAELVVLKFDPQLLYSVAGREAEQPLLLPFVEGGRSPALHFTARETAACGIEAILDDILREMNQRAPGYLYALRGAIDAMTLRLLRALAARPDYVETAAAETPEAFYAVLAYIEEHYGETIPLSRLLELCHLSYSNFALKFKRLTGKSLTAYLNSLRLFHARRLLCTTELPVTAVAAACGFEDPCYFDRLFKREAGLSPTAYRAREKG